MWSGSQTDESEDAEHAGNLERAAGRFVQEALDPRPTVVRDDLRQVGHSAVMWSSSR